VRDARDAAITLLREQLASGAPVKGGAADDASRAVIVQRGFGKYFTHRTGHSIDASVDSALARLYAQDPSSRELIGKARGVLVFPTILSAGFVVGGSYGQGALRMHGRTAEYYSTAAGSVGLLAGAESKAVFLLFMTDEALDKFRASKGWTVGADASVTLVNVGANAQVDSKTAQQAIIGYVLTNGGLMANVSLEGTKITPLAM
jgi:lipid-binding SYLF domain-containing protein